MPPTSTEASEDDSGPVSAKSWQLGDQKAEPKSPAGGSEGTGSDVDDHDGAAANAPSLPVQKRRRVTRACDECRRKKIKCDGKQPCTHCSVYSYECTYDKPSNRRRNPAPQYIEALESRLQRAESLLRQFIPDVDLADPNLDPAVKQEFRNRERARVQAAKLKQAQAGFGETKSTEDAQLLSMIESIGQLDLDEQGDWDFHGASSGAVFLRRMKEHFGGLLGPPEKVPFLPPKDRNGGLGDLDSPHSASGSSPFGSASNSPVDLPPKDVAMDLCYYSLNCATCLNRIVHLPSFYEGLDKLYRGPLDNLGTEGTHFLGLVYAVMSLGCMYRALDETKPQRPAYQDGLGDGQMYYDAAKRLLPDANECRDMTSLQALIFLILFQQATVKLSACYSTIGIALRSALRMGLHRHIEHDLISPIEQETRRRVFYVIRQMDIYVSTLLGFPLLLNDEDVDQQYPTEVDDEYIQHDVILAPPPGTPSFIEAFNAHTRLMEILAKIVKYVYPTKGFTSQGMPDMSSPSADAHNAAYVISYAKIKQIERDLQEWYERLPEAWRPSTEGSVEAVRIRHLLRFTYAHVQLVLYRPFLHYVSPRVSRGKNVDELSYACAAAAISVSRNIVHIGIEIRKQGVLIGPYWFMLYTEFFAILSLVFYSTENPQKPGSAEVLADATAGRNMIANLVDKSIVADRVTKTLHDLFDKLPSTLDMSSAARKVPPSKKRTATTEASATTTAGTTPMNPAIVIQQRRSEEQARSHQQQQQHQMLSNGFGGSHGRSSFDSLPLGDSMYPDPTGGASFHQQHAASLQNLLPMDMVTGAGTDASVYAAAGGSNSASDALHSLHKLDALMFPSEDPFAYPNQPMMELGFQQRTQRGSASGQGAGVGGVLGGSRSLSKQQQQDAASSFFMPGPFDDLDPQLMGQLPPFVMQESPGLEMPGSMYPPPMTATTSTSSLGSSAQQRSGGGGRGAATNGGRGNQGSGGPAVAATQVGRRGVGTPGEEVTRREQMLRQQERQMEQILAAQRFRGEWGGVLGAADGGGGGSGRNAGFPGL